MLYINYFWQTLLIGERKDEYDQRWKDKEYNWRGISLEIQGESSICRWINNISCQISYIKIRQKVSMNIYLRIISIINARIIRIISVINIRILSVINIKIISVI